MFGGSDKDGCGAVGGFFSLAFVAFGTFGTGMPSCGTEYACGAQKGFLRYATHFRKPSVLKTGFYGTEGISGARTPPPPLVPNAFLGALVLNGTFVQTGSGAFSCFTIKTRHETPQKLQMKYSKNYK